MTTYRDAERGSVSVLFCFIVLTAGVLVTALVDAGANIQAGNRADAASAEAARAAAIAVGPVPVGRTRDTQLAVAAANSYLEQIGASGVVQVEGPGLVQVTVTITDSTPLLGLPVRQTRAHSAQLEVGLVDGEPVR